MLDFPSARRRARIHKGTLVMRLEVTAVRFLWFLVFATWACATSAPPPLLLELNYWEQTNPLLEKAILEGALR